jgi:TIR domain
MMEERANEDQIWDVFISHAAEDKATVARPLAEALRKAGVRVWLDEHELKVGDSLSEKIDEGLARSRFGAVILSPAFLAKHWPKRELAGLRAREEQGRQVILPIWHNVDKNVVAHFSPVLADVLAVSTDQGIPTVAARLVDVIFAPTSDSPSGRKPPIARRLIEILESEPDKPTLVNFLASHLRRASYLGWGAPLRVERYELGGMQFDAYAPYVGHGLRLALVVFTDVWKNPFKTSQTREKNLEICDEIISVISTIRVIQERFSTDPELHNQVTRDLAYHARGAASWLDLGDYYRWEPDLSFFVFAGRRSSIDANKRAHAIWSELLKENRDITIRSYDYLIDGFLDR